MTNPQPQVGPPTKHQLALMIWIAVFPTLTVLNLTLGPCCRTQGPCCAPSSWRPSRCRS
jgi:antibiotic biosynthesis monooxygenase (ABM) superfamily enzyme